MSVFYSLNPKVLLEIDYSQEQYNNSAFPLKQIIDSNETAKIIVQNADFQDVTNNLENNVYVETENRTKAILNKNNAYYYPEHSDSVVVQELWEVNAGLNYITIRFHILAGYNFQESQGLLMSLWALTTTGKKIYFLKQAFLKNQIHRYKYNEIAKNYGQFFYDKYIEFKVLDYNDINIGGINKTYFDNPDGGKKITFADSPVLYAGMADIATVDYSNGYVELSENGYVSISFSPRDEFDLLTAHVSAHRNGYIQYGAKWDSGSIENFIYRLNSINGNAYYIIHELDIYEQNGQSLLKVDTITQIQTDSFDVFKRIRPIISGNANGGMKVVYTVRLFNKNTGDSIIKSATLSVLDVSAYLENITRIAVPEVSSPMKVYNMLKTETIFPQSQQKIQKIITPIYINSYGVTLEKGFSLKLSQFDNFYEIKLFQEKTSGLSVFKIEPSTRHRLVFSKQLGTNISVDETIDNNKRNNGSLLFRISASIAKNILANKITIFSLVMDSGSITTKLADGTVEL